MTKQKNEVTTDVVLKHLMKCQGNRGIQDYQRQVILSSYPWREEKIDVRKIILPYDSWLRKEEECIFSRAELTIPQAVEELRASKCDILKSLLNDPLMNAPPVIVLRCSDGVLRLFDGCKRAFSAYYQHTYIIDAYIGDYIMQKSNKNGA